MKFSIKQITPTHKGLFANTSYNIGEVIAKLEGNVFTKPNRFTYQVAPNKHISCDNDLKYINHSCYPNLKVENEQLVCIQPINISDELMFDYNTNEDVLAEPFKCNCCDKWIRGKNYTAQ